MLSYWIPLPSVFSDSFHPGPCTVLIKAGIRRTVICRCQWYWKCLCPSCLQLTMQVRMCVCLFAVFLNLSPCRDLVGSVSVWCCWGQSSWIGEFCPPGLGTLWSHQLMLPTHTSLPNSLSSSQAVPWMLEQCISVSISTSTKFVHQSFRSRIFS